MKTEFARNLTGYILLLLGVATGAFGELEHLPDLTKTGGALVTASLVALQAKRDNDQKGKEPSPDPTSPAA